MSKKTANQYFEALKKCIYDKKIVLDILKKIPKKNYPEMNKLIGPFFVKLNEDFDWSNDYSFQEQKFTIFQIQYFFQSTKFLQEQYIASYQKELELLLEVYVRPDLQEIMAESYIDYNVRIGYKKNGIYSTRI